MKNKYLLLLSLAFTGTLLLEGCQKEIQIENSASAKIDAIQSKIIYSSKIIYKDVNPDITMILNSASRNPGYNLDFNGDGIPDFSINGIYRVGFAFTCWVSTTSFNNNGVLTDASGVFPLEMSLNNSIASESHWKMDTTLTLRRISRTGLYSPTYHWSGNWTDATDHYLGVKINFGGNNYYGWIRLAVSVSLNAGSFTIKDYAYNSAPNQPILAGQTQ